MHLDEDSLNELYERFEVEWPSDEIVAEFNRRVAMPDDDVEVVGIANELYPTMAKFGSSSPGSNYAELRELEKTTKAFFVYEHLVSAAVARQDSLVEVRLWQLEAARRLASDATYDISYWRDGERSRLQVWSTGAQLAVNADDIEPSSPLAPVERRINELVDRAALRVLEYHGHDDVDEVVRLYHDELPQAAAKLEGLDVARSVAIAVRFRDAAGHSNFRPWLEEQSRSYRSVLSLEDYVSGTWPGRIPLRMRGSYLERAEWLLENWADSDLSEEPDAGASHHEGAQPLTASNGVDDLEILGRLSWTAYVGPVAGWLTLLVFLLPAWLLFGASLVLGLVTLVWLGFGVYRCLVIRSVILFLDDEGVWVQRGVLPWDRGTYGVKWRDVDEAVFLPGFLDWATSSYTVVVRHRFTKEAEVMLTHVVNGAGVVERINERLAAEVSSAGRG